MTEETFVAEYFLSEILFKVSLLVGNRIF